ncbi:Asp23/Gls24 family envelope stress response protein [Phytohabitans sp. LJ34]|uniref:Asp23/Gls24 family envelope stress response protein n=1 Tax=Phytohabitans sp. LJ34 TaxID=3452217 RepID=UPI003F8B2BD0
MTDVAAQVPAQREETTPDETVVEVVEAAPATTPAPSESNGTVAQVSEQISDAVDRAGDAVERAAAASGRVASQVVERLRNNAELAAERGTTSIADEVVEKIAGIATREVPGVYDLGGDVARFFANVKERIGLGDADEDADRGMSVRLEGRTAVINITLVIEYGFVVHSVTEKVRAKVISSVENLLGLEVTEVNIRVDDVHVDDAGPVGGDETRAAGYQP